MTGDPRATSPCLAHSLSRLLNKRVQTLTTD